MFTATSRLPGASFFWMAMAWRSYSSALARLPWRQLRSDVESLLEVFLRVGQVAVTSGKKTKIVKAPCQVEAAGSELLLDCLGLGIIFFSIGQIAMLQS